MRNVPSDHADHSQPGGPRGDVPDFVPPIDTEEIFRELIADELRCGRLTRAQRRRIVRYGAAMGLSAVQIGRLVTSCREQALQSDNQTERYHALRLVEPPPPLIPTPVKIGLVVGAAIVIDVLLIMSLL
jgi:hypothetical protein